MLKKGFTASITITIIIASVLFIASCDVMSEKGLEESLDVVPNVDLIEGAENASIRVNKGSNSNFNIDIQNVEWNNLISNGEKPAWCIAWDAPISSNNTSYDGIGIYSAKNEKQFEPINRLFTIKSQLLKADPEITWREIQVAIWSLLDHPQFDMYDTENLPNEVKSNGQPNFDHSKVEDIISAVKGNGASKLLASSESNDLAEKTVCIIVTEGDTQTVIVECDDTAYAYGGIFEADYSGYAGDDDDEIATCFPSVEEANENKWGWTNGALEPGEYNWPMYAGAGRCILNKGTNVGSLNVDFFQDGNSYTAEVTFNLSTSYYDISGYDFTSLLHLYVGSTETPPSGNFAPGNFYVEGDENYYDQQIISQDNDNLTVTYEVTGLPAEIWVIGHIGG